MIKTAVSNDDMVLWQEATDENGDFVIPEPAIFIRIYSDTISIEQEGNCINVSKDKKNVDELIKALKKSVSAS